MIALVGPYALGIDENGKPVPFTHLWREDVLMQTAALTNTAQFLGGGVIHDRVISYVNIWSQNFFHFILETMGSLVCMDTESFDYILIKSPTPAYIPEGLGILGLADKAYAWEEGPVLFENLIEPYCPRNNGYSSPESLAGLKKLAPTKEATRDIFISRADALTRRIHDEAGVLPDFEHVVTSKMSLVEQIELFAEAKTIAGPHGAGLVNMIWAPKGCHIIEYEGDYENPCFKKLAESLGHMYEKIECVQLDGEMLIP